jgi:hypothetical protein
MKSVAAEDSGEEVEEGAKNRARDPPAAAFSSPLNCSQSSAAPEN